MSLKSLNHTLKSAKHSTSLGEPELELELDFSIPQMVSKMEILVVKEVSKRTPKGKNCNASSTLRTTSTQHGRRGNIFAESGINFDPSG